MKLAETIKKHQFLFEELTARDFKQKYKRTILGAGWSLVYPLLTLLIQSVVFSRFFADRTAHYTIYLFAGNIVFSYFREATMGGMYALIMNAHIFSKVNVPKYIFVLTCIPMLAIFGVTGIAIIFYFLADLPIGIQTLVYNIPLLYAAYRTLGRNYTVEVVLGTVIFSACLDMTRFLNAYAPVNDLMLAAIFGGVFNGIGYGMVFRMNGSTGGFDIIGAMVKKYYSFQMGGVIFAFNCVIMLIAGFLFGVAPAMFTLICMYVNASVTDKVIAGLNSRKAILIVSNRAEDIAEVILLELGRGVTFLHGQGAFTRKERDVVFAVVSLTQIGKVKLITHTLDEHAFMIIMSASEVMGRGFTQSGVKIEELMERRALQQEERKKRNDGNNLPEQ